MAASRVSKPKLKPKVTVGRQLKNKQATKADHKKQAGKCYLLSLPAEIRNQIFSLAVDFWVALLGLRYPHKPLPTLYRTCRQIRNETKAVYRHRIQIAIDYAGDWMKRIEQANKSTRDETVGGCQIHIERLKEMVQKFRDWVYASRTVMASVEV